MTTSSSAASRSGIVAGVVLRAARLSPGLSEARLAAIVGTDSLTISAWENGSSYLAFDVSYLLADPLAANDAFRELLAWSLTGRMPDRYRRYAPQAPLLDPQVAALIANAVQVLARACGTGPSDPVTRLVPPARQAGD